MNIMRHRFLAAIGLALCSCSCVMAQKFTVENAEGVKIKYEVLSSVNKTVQVTGGSRPDELIIPPTVEYKGITYKVTEIKDKAYFKLWGGNYMTRLVLPEGLISIGDRAFRGALKKNTASIYVPSSVLYIGGDAFLYVDGMGENICDYKIENLPSFINTSNCYDVGIATKCVAIYDAQNRNRQQADDYVKSSSTSSEDLVHVPATPIPQQIVSDVDTNLPSSNVNNSKTFAVIIGNEKYVQVAQVPYAQNDAKVFAEYCKKTMGLPENNVRQYDNATYGTMLAAISDIKSIAKAYKGNVNVIFYYAGHGIPNETSRDAYLLPVDANGQQTEVCYPVSRLYKELGALGARNVVVFMDACFSGAQRGEGMLASTRGVAIKANADSPQGNMVVFSAASGEETAFPYEEKGHGMFTYFLLKKLRDTRGECTLGELGQYIQENVSQQSVVVNRKSQTPTITPSKTLVNTWRNLKLK